MDLAGSHSSNSLGASTTRPVDRGSRHGPRPSYGDTRPTRTPGRTTDETGGSPGKMVAMRPDQVHLTTRAKGRVERGFLTAQDRLVKGLRVAGVTTLEGANHYLETEFLPWVNSTLAVVPAHPDDAHRPLEKHHDLNAILSHVERRRVNSDYTFPLEAKTYRIVRQ